MDWISVGFYEMGDTSSLMLITEKTFYHSWFQVIGVHEKGLLSVHALYLYYLSIYPSAAAHNQLSGRFSGNQLYQKYNWLKTVQFPWLRINLANLASSLSPASFGLPTKHICTNKTKYPFYIFVRNLLRNIRHPWMSIKKGFIRCVIQGFTCKRFS